MFSDFFWGEKTKNPKNPKSPENQLEKAQKTQPKKPGFFGLGFLTLPTLRPTQSQIPRMHRNPKIHKPRIIQYRNC